MYEQASAVADELGLARGELDEWALRSHQRAIAAIDSGRMAEEIVAVEVPRARRARARRHRRGAATRHHARAPGRAAAARPRAPDAHGRQLARRQRRRGHARAWPTRIWRGSGSSSRSRASSRPGCTANRHDSLARVPARAAQIALERAGLTAPDMEVIEINEAFASVALQSSRDLGVDRRARQRQRRRRRARPPGRRLRRAAGGDADVRAAAPRRRARPGRDLLGRRAGRRDRDRGRRRVTERVLVVGAGQMGAGIAQVAAAAGMRVTLVDVGEEQLERGRAGIAASLAKLAAKGQCDDPDAVLARISTSTQTRGSCRCRARDRGRQRGRGAQARALPRSSTRRSAKTPCWHRTRRRSRSGASRRPRGARPRSAGCTS